MVLVQLTGLELFAERPDLDTEALGLTVRLPGALRHAVQLLHQLPHLAAQPEEPLDQRLLLSLASPDLQVSQPGQAGEMELLLLLGVGVVIAIIFRITA